MNFIIWLIINFTLYYGGSYYFSSPPAKLSYVQDKLAISFPLKGEVLVMGISDTIQILNDLEYPFAISFDPYGNLFVGERHTGRIYLFPSENPSNPILFYEIQEPVDILWTNIGIFLVSRKEGVLLLDYTGNPIPSGWDTIEFYTPFAICADTISNRVFVVDKKGTRPWIRLRAFDYYANAGITLWEREEAVSYGLDYRYEDCSLYIPDALWGKIYKFIMEGEELDSSGTFGSEPGSFKVPMDIEITNIPSERIFVANYENSRVDLFYFEPVKIRKIGNGVESLSKLIINPNLFGKKLKVEFLLKTSSHFSLSLVSEAGRIVKVLEEGYGKEGWNSREFFIDLPAGKYFIVLKKDGETISRKILKVR